MEKDGQALARPCSAFTVVVPTAQRLVSMVIGGKGIYGDLSSILCPRKDRFFYSRRGYSLRVSADSAKLNPHRISSYHTFPVQSLSSICCQALIRLSIHASRLLTNSHNVRAPIDETVITLSLTLHALPGRVHLRLQRWRDE